MPLSDLSSADGVAVPGMAVDDEAELRVGPNGWCFLGSLSEEKRNDFVARIVTDPRLSEIVSVCETKLSMRYAHVCLYDTKHCARFQ